MSSKNSPNRILKKDEQPITKQFGYELDGVSLRFGLRIDVKKELKAFLELIEAAKKDVAEELKNFDK